MKITGRWKLGKSCLIRRVNEKIQLSKSSEVEINDSMRVLAFDTRMAGCAIDYNYISDVIARVTMRRTGERCLWALPSDFGETSASFLVPFAFISFFSFCFAFLSFFFICLSFWGNKSAISYEKSGGTEGFPANGIQLAARMWFTGRWSAY